MTAIEVQQMIGTFRLLGYLSACLVLLTVVGCGKSLVIVKGQVNRSGKPLQLKPREEIEVTFYAADEGQEKALVDVYRAYVRPDSTYVMAGQTGKGIPRGKYKIVVGQGGKRKKDKKGGNIGKEAVEGSIREVTGKEPIDIDLDHPNG